MILNRKLKPLLLCGILSLTFSDLSAQFSKRDLAGRYSMNHDGWEGTLVIEERKVDCTTNPWCDLNIYYIDSKNNTLKAAITNVSKDWQHITFLIGFPDHRQQFSGHFFSWNKNLMAGTTDWRDKTYGFFARKQTTLSIDPNLVLREAKFKNVYELKRNLNEDADGDQDKIIKRGINGEGKVEVQYESGKIVIYGEGSTTIITPEKERLVMMHMEVMDLVPPIPDEPEMNEWLTTLNRNMDDIVNHLVDGDETSLSNYTQALSEFSSAERINKGMKMIGFLID